MFQQSQQPKPQHPLHPNVKAFLDMIAWSEGVLRVPGNDDGYNVIVGDSLFKGYANHPNKLVHLQPGLSSTAAGRYQFLFRTWDSCRQCLQLPDFGKDSQDRAAELLLRWNGSLEDVKSGRFTVAMAKAAKTWASLPGAGYGQRENRFADLMAQYKKAGGTVA